MNGATLNMKGNVDKKSLHKKLSEIRNGHINKTETNVPLYSRRIQLIITYLFLFDKEVLFIFRKK